MKWPELTEALEALEAAGMDPHSVRDIESRMWFGRAPGNHPTRDAMLVEALQQVVDELGDARFVASALLQTAYRVGPQEKP